MTKTKYHKQEQWVDEEQENETWKRLKEKGIDKEREEERLDTDIKLLRSHYHSKRKKMIYQ